MGLFSFFNSNNNKKDGNAVLTKERIMFEIGFMLTKHADDAFVIFTEPKSGKFVQFAGNKNEALLFDLPSGQLSEAEFKRATELLAAYDIHPDAAQTYTDQNKMTINGIHHSFTKSLGNNIELATDLTLRIMTEVFEFSENIKITINTEKD